MSSESPLVPESVVTEPIDQSKKGFSVYAIVSAITGVLTYLLIFLHSLVDMSFIAAAILAPISALVAIFTGHRAKREIRRSDGNLGGKKLANTGLTLGYIYIIIVVLILVLAVLGVGSLISNITNLLG